MNEIKEKKERKKKKLKWQIKLFLVIILILLYAFFIGTRIIITKEFRIKTNKIDNITHGLKILQFSDLNYGYQINENTLKELSKKINNTKPDVVIFTGDLIYNKSKITQDDEKILTSYLSKIESEYGKYYINGEEDNENSSSILSNAGFINLENNEQLIYKSNKTPILITSKNSVKTFFESNEDFAYYKLLVLHNPDDFDSIKEFNFDLVIAGHNLNGYVGIPKLNNLFISSKYKNTYQKVDNTEFFINPGIGTRNIKFRIFNHPKIYLFRLNKVS